MKNNVIYFCFFSIILGCESKVRKNSFIDRQNQSNLEYQLDPVSKNIVKIIESNKKSKSTKVYSFNAKNELKSVVNLYNDKKDGYESIFIDKKIRSQNYYIQDQVISKKTYYESGDIEYFYDLLIGKFVNIELNFYSNGMLNDNKSRYVNLIYESNSNSFKFKCTIQEDRDSVAVDFFDHIDSLYEDYQVFNKLKSIPFMNINEWNTVAITPTQKIKKHTFVRFSTFKVAKNGWISYTELWFKLKFDKSYYGIQCDPLNWR